MNNIIYEEITKYPAQNDEWANCEKILVTKESNGHAVWFCDNDSTKLIKYFHLSSKPEIIRFAISEADRKIGLKNNKQSVQELTAEMINFINNPNDKNANDLYEIAKKYDVEGTIRNYIIDRILKNDQTN